VAFVHGKGTVFKLDDSGGTLRDISAYLDEVTFPATVDLAETTTFGKNDKTYIAGLRSRTVSLSGKWDSVVDGYYAAALGQSATLSFEYGPAGSGSGAVKYTGECLISSYEISNPVGDVVTFSIELQTSDTITVGTYS
jgi:hypothetical protein